MSQQQSNQAQNESALFDEVANARAQLQNFSLGHHDSDSHSACSSPDLEVDSSRASIASIQTPPSPASQADDSMVADSFVYAFDIDGVLVRGGKAIPEALQAMKVLNGENEYGIKV
jgi:hypothetical protein